MPFFELINVHPDYQYSSARLFKAYVDETGKYELVIPGRADTTDAQPAVAAIRSEALRLNCPYYIVGDMNRIGENVIVTVSMHATGSGDRVWGDKLKAANPGDLDPIFQKLARAAGNRSKATQDGDIYSVTSYETKELRQVQAKNSFGVALGGTLFTPGLLAGKTWNEPFVGGLGFVWAYDARSVLFEVDAESYALARNSKLNMLSISAFKPVHGGTLTPFFGGGLGIGSAGTEYAGRNSEGQGLLAHAGAGLILNRISNVQLRVQGRYIFGLFQMSEPRGDMPRAMIVRMELLFGR